MLVTSEASYHAAYDHCTARYLVQAGVTVDFVRLETRGIHGNGHMMMLEKNNLQISQLIAAWLDHHVSLAGEDAGVIPRPTGRGKPPTGRRTHA